MKKALVTLASLVFLVSTSTGEELSPQEIISMSWKLYRQAIDEKESVRMVIEYEGGRKEEKKLNRWTRFDPAGEDCITIKFLEPPLDRGLGLLTLRHADGRDEQWLKLPSMKKVRKVATGDQDKYFAGTDFTNEDIRQLIGEHVRDFTYRLSGKDGEVRIIESLPATGVETGYGRRLIWVDSRFVITKVEYFGKKGDLIKTQTNSTVNTSGNGRWRIDAVEMDNRLLKRKTRVAVEAREIDRGIPSHMFSKDFLEDERL